MTVLDHYQDDTFCGKNITRISETKPEERFHLISLIILVSLIIIAICIVVAIVVIYQHKKRSYEKYVHSGFALVL